jgi:hypothetical protein
LTTTNRAETPTPHEARLPTSHVAFGLALALVWFVCSVVIAVAMIEGGSNFTISSLVALVVVGFASLVPQAIAIQFHLTLDGFALLSVFWQPMMGFAIGWLAHFLWQKGNWVRWVIPTLLVLNSLAIGVMLVLLGASG